MFGGSAGVQQPTLLGGNGSFAQGGMPGGGSAGAGASGAPTVSAVCQDVPLGTRALLDDFEDDDLLAVPEPFREAYWFTVDDGTAGNIAPAAGSSFLPAPGGVHGSAFAAHVTASGFSDWGAELGANVSHVAAGIRCPYNASKFSGFRFYARGTGSMRVELWVPEVVALDTGGSCDPKTSICYDTHGLPIFLSQDWKLYSIKWDRFEQRGFGSVAVFRPEAIVSIAFAFEKEVLPSDVWIDDVSWDDGSPAATGSGGAADGGTSGAGGAG